MNPTTKALDHETGLTVRLTLRAEFDPFVPANSRLRRLLKMMLRSYGFRCVRVEDMGISRFDGDNPNENTDQTERP